MEIRDLYSQLCVDGLLKEENTILERQGLTYPLDFLDVFETKWIKIILSRIHDHSIWLEDGPIKILKKNYPSSNKVSYPRKSQYHVK